MRLIGRSGGAVEEASGWLGGVGLLGLQAMRREGVGGAPSSEVGKMGGGGARKSGMVFWCATRARWSVPYTTLL